MSNVERVLVARANSNEPGGVVTPKDATKPADNPATIPATTPRIFLVTDADLRKINNGTPAPIIPLEATIPRAIFLRLLTASNDEFALT